MNDKIAKKNWKYYLIMYNKNNFNEVELIISQKQFYFSEDEESDFSLIKNVYFMFLTANEKSIEIVKAIAKKEAVLHERDSKFKLRLLIQLDFKTKCEITSRELIKDYSFDWNSLNNFLKDTIEVKNIEMKNNLIIRELVSERSEDLFERIREAMSEKQEKNRSERVDHYSSQTVRKSYNAFPLMDYHNQIQKQNSTIIYNQQNMLPIAHYQAASNTASNIPEKFSKLNINNLQKQQKRSESGSSSGSIKSVLHERFFDLKDANNYKDLEKRMKRKDLDFNLNDETLIDVFLNKRQENKHSDSDEDVYKIDISVRNRSRSNYNSSRNKRNSEYSSESNYNRFPNKDKDNYRPHIQRDNPKQYNRNNNFNTSIKDKEEVVKDSESERIRKKRQVSNFTDAPSNQEQPVIDSIKPCKINHNRNYNNIQQKQEHKFIDKKEILEEIKQIKLSSMNIEQKPIMQEKPPIVIEESKHVQQDLRIINEYGKRKIILNKKNSDIRIIKKT